MEMTDFGRYRGTQKFDFCQERGVELLWGENGLGKTTFLNALRWVLFGVILGRGSSRIPLSDMGNRDDDDLAAIRPFKVVLSFTHADHEYKLTRTYRKDRSGLHSGEFTTTCILVMDGDALGAADRDRRLAALLPEQISRFFLFDAELLQEYEQLLKPGSEAGDKLKAAIERVLGLPVLTRARDDIASQLVIARRAQAKAAQQDRATKDLGNELQLASEDVEREKENFAELTEIAEDQQNAVNELEKKLNNNNRFRGLLGARDARRKERDSLEAKARERADELLEAAGGTWRAILEPTVNRELALIQDRTDEFTQQMASAVKADLAAAAVESGTCPTCQQPLGDSAAEALSHVSSEIDADAVQAELAALRARREALRGLRADGARIVRLEDEASQAKVELSDADSNLRDLDAQLADAPAGTAEVITNLIDRHAQATVGMTNTRLRLKTSKEELGRKEKFVAAVSAKLQRQGASGSGEEAQKVQLLDELHRLLSEAVNEFRDRLRDHVEEQASEVFRALSAEKDYARLRINDSYGLTILHADGSEVLNRSSGYEHVVALSLIAALQRCSPMSGPIITDSPFGRLDKTHKEHVLRTLPQITDQVLLLVHDDELDRVTAMEQLGTSLVAEHYLRRVSARHTLIETGAQQ
jgi:DNA sulfur modification protein DndD